MEKPLSQTYTVVLPSTWYHIDSYTTLPLNQTSRWSFVAKWRLWPMGAFDTFSIKKSSEAPLVVENTAAVLRLAELPELCGYSLLLCLDKEPKRMKSVLKRCRYSELCDHFIPSWQCRLQEWKYMNEIHSRGMFLWNTRHMHDLHPSCVLRLWYE